MNTYLVWIEISGDFKTGYDIDPAIGPLARVEPDKIVISGSKTNVYDGTYVREVIKDDTAMFFKHTTEDYWIVDKDVSGDIYWGITTTRAVPALTTDFLYITAVNATLESNPDFVGQGTEDGTTATSVYDDDFEAMPPEVKWTGKSGWWYFEYDPQEKLVGHIMKDNPVPEFDGYIPFVITPDDENIGVLDDDFQKAISEIHGVTCQKWVRNTTTGAITIEDTAGTPLFVLTPAVDGRDRSEI